MKDKFFYFFCISFFVFIQLGCRSNLKTNLISDIEGKTWILIKEKNKDYSHARYFTGYVFYDHGISFQVQYDAKELKETLLSTCLDCGEPSSIKDAYLYWKIVNDTLILKKGRNSSYNIFKGKIIFLSDDSLVTTTANNTYIFNPQ